MGELDQALLISSKTEKIAVLGDFLDIGTVKNMDEEQKAIFNKAQTELLSIPGHAKYYQDKIEEMRAGVLRDSKKTPQELEKMHDNGQKIMWEATYLTYSENAIRTLKFLPSSETVSVLGHFLDDPEGKDGKTLLGNDVVNPGDDFTPRPSNAERAAMSIRNLGIEHPPFQAPRPNPYGGIFEGELDAWQSWWNQVKDGKRTYRFIGSKIEYGPDGPASKDVIQRVERDRKRDEERLEGHKKVSSSDSDPSSEVEAHKKSISIASIVAACVVILSMVWYFRRKRLAWKA